MMRWMGFVLVMSGSVFMGFWYRLSSLRKCRNLLQLQRAMVVLEGEISYARTPLPEAFLEMAKRTGGRVSEFFREVAEHLNYGGENFEAIWKRALEEIMDERELAKEDRNELEELGNTLGYLDSDMQLQALRIYQKRLEQSISFREREKEKKARLYPVLSTISGLLICLLLL